jgi:sulfur transfer protein SufE
MTGVKNKGKGKKHDFPAMSLSAPSSQSKAHRNKVTGCQDDVRRTGNGKNNDSSRFLRCAAE